MTKRLRYVYELLAKRWGFVVGVAMLLTFVLVLYLGKNQSVWFDESYSILLAKRPVGELLALTNVDAHPPLSYLLLKVWGELFGWTELALRSLSALLAAMAVGASALLVRRLYSPRVALAVLPFLVLAPFWLRYGYEIRMYALAGLICVVASLVLLKATALHTSKRWWGAYAVLVALGMYTLYMTLVVWLAHAVWLFMNRKSQTPLRKQPGFLAYVAAVGLFLPQIPVFIYQMLHSALPGVGSAMTLNKLISTFGMLVVYKPDWQIGGWLSLAFFIVTVLFGVLYVAVIHSKKYRSGLLFVTVLVVVPLIFYTLTSLPPREPIFIERYMAHIALFVAMLIGLTAVLGWLAGRRRVAVAFSVGVLALSGFGVYHLSTVGNLNFERMQLPMTREIRAELPCSSNTQVVADDPYTYIDSVYYLHDCNLVFYSKDDVAFEGGYAMLHGSNRRLGSGNDLTARTVVHLYWANIDKTFTVPDSYRLVSSKTYDQQVVEIYTRR